MSVLTSPARRVLGEKDANTLLLPQQSPEKTKLDLELGSPRMRKPVISSGSLHAGQKRKIQQVDDEEAAESQNINASHTLSQRTELLSDEERSGHEEGFYTSLAETRSTPNTVFTSFHPSQEEHPQQLEAEFVILEEPSQQTLDKMVCVSLHMSLESSPDDSSSTPCHLRRTLHSSCRRCGRIWPKSRLKSA
jgi:hypothetical protein